MGIKTQKKFGGLMNIQDKVQAMVGRRDQNKVKREKLLKGEAFVEQERNKVNASWDEKQKSLLAELRSKFREIPEAQVISVLKKHQFVAEFAVGELEMILSHLKEAEEDDDWVNVVKNPSPPEGQNRN